MTEAIEPHKRGIRFDPTINLGHICTAGAFLVCTALAWANLDGRVGQQKEAIVRIEGQGIERANRVETVLMSKINDNKAIADQSTLRTAEDIREIKTLLRDGFQALDAKLDRKADKPGTR